MYGKKILSLLLASALWLLCGCAREDSEMQRALDFRTALLQSGGCAFTAEVTADYGEQVYRFTMDCTWSPDGGAALTLTAPQTLRICAMPPPKEEDSASASSMERLISSQ